MGEETTKKKLKLIDLDTDYIMIDGGSTIIYSKNLFKYLEFINNLGTYDEPAWVFVTTEGHLYCRCSTGEVFMYVGNELQEWRKLNE